MGTICCPECHGYGTLEYRKVSRWGAAERLKPGLWVCGVCQGLGSVGEPPGKPALKMTPTAIQKRNYDRRRAAERHEGA